jgi:hypothetical protein
MARYEARPMYQIDGITLVDIVTPYNSVAYPQAADLANLTFDMYFLESVPYDNLPFRNTVTNGRLDYDSLDWSALTVGRAQSLPQTEFGSMSADDIAFMMLQFMTGLLTGDLDLDIDFQMSEDSFNDTSRDLFSISDSPVIRVGQMTFYDISYNRATNNMVGKVGGATSLHIAVTVVFYDQHWGELIRVNGVNLVYDGAVHTFNIPGGSVNLANARYLSIAGR